MDRNKKLGKVNPGNPVSCIETRFYIVSNWVQLGKVIADFAAILKWLSVATIACYYNSLTVRMRHSADFDQSTKLIMHG